MSLDFKDTKEAASLFYGIKQIAVIKNMAIKIHAQKDGILGEAPEKSDEKRIRDRENVQKKLRNLAVIDQYCEYIVNKDKDGFKV